MMFENQNQATSNSRRYFLNQCGVGLGKVAAAGLLAQSVGGPAAVAAGSGNVRDPLAPKTPHYAPRAKAVIHLFMAGAPSQLELFDPKPMLSKLEGKPLPASVIGDQRYAFIQPDAAVLGPQFNFDTYGQSGAVLGEPMKELGRVADEICFIRSCTTDQFNHAPAQIFFNTGFSQPGRPSIGSWALYGLGSESQDLPAFVVMSTGAGISGGTSLWSSGFMPTVYTGVQ
ncbi:MAG: DUF1501 domain-containing protein, partial [Rubripirellula sp.]